MLTNKCVKNQVRFEKCLLQGLAHYEHSMKGSAIIIIIIIIVITLVMLFVLGDVAKENKTRFLIVKCLN